jgi:hypothetical protein
VVRRLCGHAVDIYPLCLLEGAITPLQFYAY